MSKSYDEINEKIKQRQAVVVTAEEIIRMVREKGLKKTARDVDVVTTGTFGPMCSSGAFINFGHAKPRIRATRVLLNDVEAYAGIAAVDCYIGATQTRHNAFDVYGNRDLTYGGGHVIHDLVSGNPVHLKAESDGSDCYPSLSLEKDLVLEELPNAFLFCPRNGYQNYPCAVNKSDKIIHTYMGALKPHIGNATYSSAGQLSPLINDPLFKTIGLGTRIFLGGGVGYVTGPGTQHNPDVPRTDQGVPTMPAGTLAVTGDLKTMNGRWLKGLHYRGYGATMRVGIGVPIPVLNEDILMHTAVSDADIKTVILDFSHDYPYGTGKVLGEVNYEQLRSGALELEGKSVPCFPQSNYSDALCIARILKSWIERGVFLLGQPVELLPSEGRNKKEDRKTK
ncbi:homocysteine biosynthesis protein [bacterium]|nr:homocysteine biosynthesis protein [bacterium]